jgi:predicted NodU family carbamoyl transferase
MNILGISAYYHDSAAALIRDGEIIAAAQEERFSRKKHDARFPKNAIAYCLKEANIDLRELDRHSLLRQTFSQIRAPSRNLFSLRTPRFSLFPSSHADMAQRKALPQNHAQKRSRSNSKLQNE